MPDAIEGVSTESVTPVIATDDAINDNVDNSATETATETAVVDGKAQESTETAETQETKTDVDDPKIPQNFRDHVKELEADIKAKYKPAYSGLEKVATDLFGANTSEDIQAAIQTVQALAPSIKVLTDPNATDADVVATMQRMLPPEHLEKVAWAALNDPATQDVIFADDEVLNTISEKLFDGKSLEEVKAALANVPETEVDPKYAEMERRLKATEDRDRENELQNERTAAQTRIREFSDRFYEAPAQRVIAEDFKLVAPAGSSEADRKAYEFASKAAKFTAQALFIEQNGVAAEQLQNLHSSGKRISAEAIKSEIGLANRYEATLIKTAEFFAKLLKSRSVATIEDQQKKIDDVRPDVTGSVQGGNGKPQAAPYDVDDPGFMTRFQRDVNPAFHN